MTLLALTLARAQQRLLGRLQELDARLDDAPDDATWDRYTNTLATLVNVIVEPERSGRPVSARELAEKFGMSARTVRRRRRKAETGPVLRSAAR